MVEIMSVAGDAIDAAHRAGVVHRDLKPENIMIVNDGNGPPSPRVLDFGLAKFTGPAGDDDVTLVHSTQSVGIVGTVMYMAPELLNGFNADARSDQYSFGLIAYELITGSHPFASANNLASVVKGHTEGIVPTLEDVPENVAQAIYRALAKAPEERFGSVGEFVRAMA
jgi:serine/threonine protein kinase